MNIIYKHIEAHFMCLCLSGGWYSVGTSFDGSHLVVFCHYHYICRNLICIACGMLLHLLLIKLSLHVNVFFGF